MLTGEENEGCDGKERCSAGTVPVTVVEGGGEERAHECVSKEEEERDVVGGWDAAVAAVWPSPTMISVEEVTEKEETSREGGEMRAAVIAADVFGVLSIPFSSSPARFSCDESDIPLLPGGGWVGAYDDASLPLRVPMAPDKVDDKDIEKEEEAEIDEKEAVPGGRGCSILCWTCSPFEWW